MEKDYFLDRHPIVNEHNAVLPGDEVFICLKIMQKSAKKLNDLTRITVSNYLTSQEYHPRGQKVKGYEKIWDDNNKEFILEERIGRIVYKIFDKNKVLTKNGYKYIINNNNNLELAIYDNIKDLFNIIYVLTYKDFIFKIELDNSIFIEDINEFNTFINKNNIENTILNNNGISLMINKKLYNYNNFDIFIKNKKVNVDISTLFSYFTNNYKSTNNTEYEFNKFFTLNAKQYELIHPNEYK